MMNCMSQRTETSNFSLKVLQPVPDIAPFSEYLHSMWPLFLVTCGSSPKFKLAKNVHYLEKSEVLTVAGAAAGSRSSLCYQSSLHPSGKVSFLASSVWLQPFTSLTAQSPKRWRLFFLISSGWSWREESARPCSGPGWRGRKMWGGVPSKVQGLGRKYKSTLHNVSPPC